MIVIITILCIINTMLLLVMISYIPKITENIKKEKSIVFDFSDMKNMSDDNIFVYLQNNKDVIFSKKGVLNSIFSFIINDSNKDYCLYKQLMMKINLLNNNSINSEIIDIDIIRNLYLYVKKFKECPINHYLYYSTIEFINKNNLSSKILGIENKEIKKYE